MHINKANVLAHLIALSSGFTAACISTMAVGAPNETEEKAVSRDSLPLPTGLSADERTRDHTAKLDPALIHLRMQTQRPELRSSTGFPPVPAFVTVDIVTDGNVQAARQQLEALGFKTSGVYRNYISGKLPVDMIDRAAAIEPVQHMGQATAFTRSGRVAGQGDYVQLSRSLRETVRREQGKLDGDGITVGILSDSFNCNAYWNQNPGNKRNQPRLDEMDDDITNGDLPGKDRIRIVKEADCPTSGMDEGRAMAEIIHDVAPGAKISFYTALDGMADFAQGIETLAKEGAQVIVDDVGYFAEPAFQSGIIGAAIDSVVTTRGVTYFTAAGNSGRGTDAVNYVNNDAEFSGRPVVEGGLGAGARPLFVEDSGKRKADLIPLRIMGRAPDAPVYRALFQLYWDQPIDRSTSSMQVCLGDKDGRPMQVSYQGKVWPSCSDASVIGQPSTIRVALLANQPAATLRILLKEGTAPRRIRLLSSNVVIDRYGTADASIYGHALSANATTLGAADYLDTPLCDPKLSFAKLRGFSSHGGSLQVFDNNGKPLPEPRLDGKPDLVAPDGASSVFFIRKAGPKEAGFRSTNPNCRYYEKYPYQFDGTSAAAPHVAGVAALLRQAYPEATPQQIYDALRKTAANMGTKKEHDNATGSGFIQSDRAYLYLAPKP